MTRWAAGSATLAGPLGRTRPLGRTTAVSSCPERRGVASRVRGAARSLGSPPQEARLASCGAAKVVAWTVPWDGECLLTNLLVRVGEHVKQAIEEDGQVHEQVDVGHLARVGVGVRARARIGVRVRARVRARHCRAPSRAPRSRRLETGARTGWRRRCARRAAA